MIQNIVEAEAIEIRRGDHMAVAASSFTVPAAKITAIIGPNGSGKSTLLHAIAGLLPIASGSLKVHGAAAEDSQAATSYVMQYTAFPPGTPITVAETVAMGRWRSLGVFGRMKKADRDAVLEAMQRLEVTELAKRHLSELSGGQRQRVYIAQGVAQPHDLLLLDEPLTGLDLVSARTIDRLIHEEPERGDAVIHTTHDLEEARAADHVILMAGKVLAFGPPAEVLTPANLAVAYGLGSLHQADEAAALFSDHHH